MSPSRYFGGIIWTNHVLERLGDRKLPQELAFETFKNPDNRQKGKNGTTEYRKKFNTFKITVIAKQNEKKEWIILSCWRDPPLSGTFDAKQQKAYQKYLRASPLMKLLLLIKKQLGL